MIIETSRLWIREPRIEDFEEFWLMINDPVAKAFTGGVTSYSYQERLDSYKKDCETFKLENEPEFSVIEKDSKMYLAYCGFRYCEILNGVELLFGYSQKSWGKGFGFEAAKAVINFGFKELGLENIVASANPKNEASEKILKKLGMVYEGQIQFPDEGLVNKYRIKKEAYCLIV